MTETRLVRFDRTDLAAGAAVVASVVVLWQLAGHRWDTVRYLISTPEAVISYGIAHSRDVAAAITFTALESVIGLLAATFIAACFAIWMLYAPRLAAISYPWLLLSQVIPFVCLAPLIILVLGPGWIGKAFLSMLMCFFPIVTNLMSGFRSVPQPALEMMAMMKASRLVVLRHVIAPHCALPFFAALRVAAPFSVVGAIVGEFNGAQYGLGKDIFISAKRLEPELMMLSIFLGALLSVALYLSTIFLETTLGDWYKENDI